MLLLALPFATLAVVGYQGGALQLTAQPIIEVTSAPVRSCSLAEHTAFEQQLYGIHAVPGIFSQNKICDNHEAAGGLDHIAFIQRQDPTADEVEATTVGESTEPLDASAPPADAHDATTASEGQTIQTDLIVWVSGYPRSGSSTALSLVSATMDDNQAGGETFSLFEPCHDGDEYQDWQAAEGCGSVLENVVNCNFQGIKNLWGWNDPHTSSGFHDFDPSTARDMCANAAVIAFKTVDYGHDLVKWNWMLDDNPNMKVIDVVRDPRGIYASWKVLEPFKSLIEEGNFYTIADVCANFAKNLDWQNPRVHRIVFEDLLSQPYEITYNTYTFLGLPYGEKQSLWIQKVFNAKWCPPPKPGMEGFSDCHQSSANSIQKWREVLSSDEKEQFLSNPNCVRIAKEYGYPLE